VAPLLLAAEGCSPVVEEGPSSLLSSVGSNIAVGLIYNLT
jgi:hypothetical protein